MLTKTDLNSIDKRTKRIVEDNSKRITKQITKQISKAISDNNSKLFQVFLTKQDALDLFVTKDEFNERMDKNFELLDKIYGHVKRMDEEQTVISHKVENHEVRLTHIESVLT